MKTWARGLQNDVLLIAQDAPQLKFFYVTALGAVRIRRLSWAASNLEGLK